MITYLITCNFFKKRFTGMLSALQLSIFIIFYAFSYLLLLKIFTNRIYFPVDTERKLNVHEKFRRRPGRLLNVSCTFNLLPVSTGLFARAKICLTSKISKKISNGNLIKKCV